MERLTNQSAFNTVFHYFVTGGAPKSAKMNGSCRYRTDDGKRCAIGCLIPDRLYSSSIEGFSPVAVVGNDRFLDHFSGVNVALLKDLQRAHDRCPLVDFRAGMEMRLRKIAKEWTLCIPEPIDLDKIINTEEVELCNV